MKASEHLALLRAAGLSAKKSFGQNFLVSDGAIEAIATACVPPVEQGRARVVELGAGAGALTSALLARGAHVTAVERDRDLIPILERAMRESIDRGALEVLEADAQTLDLGQLFRSSSASPQPRVLAGNLPYQITGQLLRLAVTQAEHVDRVVFMVQKEVALRVVAGAGTPEYGALSVFVQAAFAPSVVLDVAAGAFVPPPRVSSAVIVLTPLRPPRAEETPTFRALVKGAFGARRKTLRNAWRAVAADAGALAEAAREAGVSLDVRGETLDVTAYDRMARALDRGISPSSAR
jgi:16S rRNA (adenine1518-N6/adenine1519-N6)-dimethyltransferase